MYLKIISFSLLVIIHQVLCQNQVKTNQNLFYDFSYEYSSELNVIYDRYLKNENNRSVCNSLASSLSPPKHITHTDIESALAHANEKLKQFVLDDQDYLQTDSRGLNFSLYLYQANLRALYNEFVTKHLANEKCMDRIDIEESFPTIVSPQKVWRRNKFCDLEDEMSHTVKCDPKYKYRREDGKCNHLKYTNWGSSFHCQRRLLPPDYADGVSAPRVARDGSALPNARLISKTLMSDIETYDNKWTSLKMSWGQFVSHDIFKTVQYFGGAIRCCPHNQSPEKPVHMECWPIENIPIDRLTVAYNQTCINFIRQIGCRTCSLGHRQHINTATPFLDLSNIYGANENNTDRIRSFKGGELLAMKSYLGDEIPPKAVLPRDHDRLDASPCQVPRDRPWLTCFRTGDGIRGSQQPLMASIITQLIRRHNQHARALTMVNPDWQDEQVYQEAKRILIAEYNVINFNEFMPAITNPMLMKYYGLNLKQNAFTKYNKDIDPNAIQSVGAAAFRFGHSTISSTFPILKKDLESSYGFRLRDKYQEVSDIYDGNANGIIKGISSVERREVDPFLVTDVSDYLYLKPNDIKIQDLASININRGRETGIPGYVYYLQYCTGDQINDWKDLKGYIPDSYIQKMSKVYKNVQDIDLWLGGLSERHMNGSTLGPTFSCLMSIQFHHLKYGDRFYFEHGGQAGSFTIEQLNNIRNTASMANMLCKTTDFKTIQRRPFQPTAIDNPLIACNKLPEFDYNLWKEGQK